MSEWSNVVDSKSIVPQGTGGSNPSLSAKRERVEHPNSTRSYVLKN